MRLTLGAESPRYRSMTGVTPALFHPPRRGIDHGSQGQGQGQGQGLGLRVICSLRAAARFRRCSPGDMSDDDAGGDGNQQRRDLADQPVADRQDGVCRHGATGTHAVNEDADDRTAHRTSFVVTVERCRQAVQA